MEKTLRNKIIDTHQERYLFFAKRIEIFAADININSHIQFIKAALQRKRKQSFTMKGNLEYKMYRNYDEISFSKLFILTAKKL